MPSVARTTSTGNSKRSNLSARAKRQAMTMATAEPISAATFMKRAKASTTKAPSKNAPSLLAEDDRDDAASDEHDEASALTAARGALAGEGADHQQQRGADRQDELRQDQRERGKLGCGHRVPSPASRAPSRRRRRCAAW